MGPYVELLLSSVHRHGRIEPAFMRVNAPEMQKDGTSTQDTEQLFAQATPH